jgi:hypothetical protein
MKMAAIDPPLVYLAGPFTATTRDGVERNIRAAEDIGIEVARLGAMPVCPHANTSRPEYEHVQGYDFWIVGTMKLMLVCNAVLMLDGWEQSNGARGERQVAHDACMTVLYSLDQLAEWLKNRSAA